MISFLKRWVILTLAVLLAANIVHGIHYDNASGLIAATLLLGILNAVVRPVMVLLSLPLLIVTLGLFMLIINALLLLFVSMVVGSFRVDGFWPALWGSLIISVVSLVLNSITKSGDSRIEFSHIKRPPPPPPPGGSSGGGPVIDV